MKKIFALILVMVLSACFCVSAFAAKGDINANEQAVLDLLSDGSVYKVPAEYVTAAENSFLSIDMTEAQKNNIIGFINEGRSIIKAQAEAQKFDGDLYDLKNMERTAKEKVLELGKKACLEIGQVLTYDSASNTVTIKDDQGQPVFSDAPVVKATGESFPVTTVAVIAAIVLAVVACAVALVVFSKKKGLIAA